MMDEYNEFNYEHKEVTDQSDVVEEKVIPAIVKSKKKSSKGKVIALTTAVALASFGAGSLFTSYNWIEQSKASIAENQSAGAETSNKVEVSQLSSEIKNGQGLSISEISNIASGSVVEITTETVKNDVFMRQYVSEGAGSGVIISSDGYIVTNNHVINGASKITVRLKDGKEYQGKLIGRDSQTDLAVVKIEGKDFTPATYGNSDELVIGDTVVAIGNPLGQLGGTVTNGIISATDRQIDVENQKMTLLQTNAAINPGNSGGGLFNDRGELIGVVVAKSKGSDIEGLGFAIPVNIVKDVVKSLMEVGYVQGRPVLGIGVYEINTPQLANYYGVGKQGVYITQITKGTKAEAGGLKVGDCIIAVEDTQIASTSDLTSILKKHKVGDQVKVIISRDGKLMTKVVELSESQPEQEETESTEQQAPNTQQQPKNGQSNDIEDYFGDLFGVFGDGAISPYSGQ